MFYRRCSNQFNFEGNSQAYSDLLNTLLPVYIISSVYIAVSSHHLLYLLSNSNYNKSVTFLKIGAGIELCRMLANLFSLASHITRKVQSLALPYTFGAIAVLVLLTMIGVKRYEIVWSGYALLISGIIVLIVMIVTANCLFKIKLDWPRFWGSIVASFVLYLISIFWPIVYNVWGSIFCLSVSGLLAIHMILFLNWKSPAVIRLLGTSLIK